MEKGATVTYYISMCLVTQSCPTLCDFMNSSPPGLGLWDSSGKNTGVGSHFLLQDYTSCFLVLISLKSTLHLVAIATNTT